MAQMSRYCKAYPANRLRGYPGWKENPSNTQGPEGRAGVSSAGEEEILYLHDNYIVSTGIFRDENIVFSEVTDEWKAFCERQLGFSIPEYQQRQQTA